MRELERAREGAGFKTRELEPVPDRARKFVARRDAFEELCHTAACRAETGELWRSRRGGRVSRIGHLASAAIDARDFAGAGKATETRAHPPREPSSPSPAARPSPTAARRSLASIKPAPDMPTRPSSTAAAPASRRSPRNRPSETASIQWRASRIGTAADGLRPSAATTSRSACCPGAFVAFPGNGIADNPNDKAMTLGIPVQRVAA